MRPTDQTRVYVPLAPEDTTGDADQRDYEEALAAAEELAREAQS